MAAASATFFIPSFTGSTIVAGGTQKSSIRFSDFPRLEQDAINNALGFGQIIKHLKVRLSHFSTFNAGMTARNLLSKHVHRARSKGTLPYLFLVHHHLFVLLLSCIRKKH